LAAQVRGGLPFGRVAALIGVDGHPATELRGLHAWLAVHLPEYADQLIEADPYGVLTYGDAASLSPSACACLVRALDKLSKSNPWFRSGNWRARPIGALARSDTVNEFRAVLNNPNAGFGVRSVVVDALSLGTPIPEMLPDLAAILARQAVPIAERLHALVALLRLGDLGKEAIRTAFQSQLGKTVNDLRPRAEIIERLYGDPYGPSDVIAVVNDTLEAEDRTVTNMLWSLADNMPLPDLPAVLDGINGPNGKEPGFEAGNFYSRILVRAWRAPDGFDPGRALSWLNKRLVLKGAYGETRARNLRLAMSETPERLRAVADHFLRTIPMDDQWWLALHRFREAIRFQLSSDELLDLTVEHFGREGDGSDRQLFLYEAGFILSYQAEQPHGAEVFEHLFNLADGKPQLQGIRTRVTATKLPDGYFGMLSHRPERDEGNIERLRKHFERDADQIRSGAHLGWLRHIGLIYWARFSDVDRGHTPRERLVATLSKANAEKAVAGLRASLSRNDVPSFAEVLTLAEQHQHYDWWYALTAGICEQWETGSGLDAVPEELLKALLAFNLTNPVSTYRDGSEQRLVHPWRTALVEQRPELARDVFLSIARVRLSKDEQIIDGLTELLNEPALRPFRKTVALELLRDFPGANTFRLAELLDAVAGMSEAHTQFLAFVPQVLTGAIAAPERQRDLWLVTAYRLSPAQYEAQIESRAQAYTGLVFDLRDHSGVARDRQTGEGSLPLPMLEFMARLTGTLFPETPHPSNVWSGNTNAWDASEHFRTLTNVISASPSQAATDALVRLEADPQLASYKPHILYTLANQRQQRRDVEYDRPDWPEAVAALANGPPATVADLHALLIAQLRDLAHRIARANTDIYKQFWNIDHYARPMDPRPEEACRDNLVTLLKPYLLPLGITVEPEGHMVADKRADISAAMPARKILCELKRDYHAEVWTALMGQLERFYAHDPEAKGFGVYCVFWFGNKRPRPIPTPPNGMESPQSAAGMEAMLKGRVPANMRDRLVVIVIDVSGEV